MLGSPMLPDPRPACFLIADISGYTGYLADVELDHAQDILADLMAAVVSTLRPAFRLAKLEGDAAFTYQATDAPDGSMLLDTIERCYFGFRRRRRDVRQATSCECSACSRIPDLNLKFVVHQGTAVQQQVLGRRELMGPDVILVHRLLKNDVVDRLGLPAYALLTQACLDAAAIEPEPLAMRPVTESYEHIGDVACWAHDLERRWRQEDARRRLFVEPTGAIIDLAIPVRVPPQVAWEFLTRPGQRMSWQPWVTAVSEQRAPGGRRGPGSSNHCMHGKDAVVEEILDWRPYDYVTDRTILATPGGPIRLLHTIELEPVPEGTIVHLRFAPPGTKRERDVAAPIATAYEAALRAAAPALVEQLEAAYVALDAGRAREAEVGVTRDDAARTRVQPIRLVD
jgi:hypothetical protein